MQIKENDFILESVNDYNNLFDLSLLAVVNKGKENERREMKVAAYGIPLETALRYIIQYRTINKLGDITSLKEYIQTYNKIYEQLKNIIK